jgi:hypothetical protein
MTIVADILKIPLESGMATYVDQVDLLARLSGYGDLTSALRNSLIGFNHRAFGAPVPYNAENYGMTFFTRPRLNLSYDNVAMDRILTPLLTEDPATYQRAIRVMLDPESGVGRNLASGNSRWHAVESNLFDRKQAFIPLLTNNLLSMSGWPDPTMDYYVSNPGVTREVWTMADGPIDIRYNWQATANFRNIIGDPITLLFHSWLRYIGNVRSGKMVPWPEEIIENRIDYQTGIWRLVLDPARKYIQKISRTIAAPSAVPLGASMDYNTDSPFNQANASQISIPFDCVGAEYNDPILFTEFNLLVCAHNTDMVSTNRNRVMLKIPPAELAYFNFFGYPRIDARTAELEWYIYRTDYQNLLNELKTGGQTIYSNKEPQS